MNFISLWLWVERWLYVCDWGLFVNDVMRHSERFLSCITQLFVKNIADYPLTSITLTFLMHFQSEVVQTWQQLEFFAPSVIIKMFLIVIVDYPLTLWRFWWISWSGTIHKLSFLPPQSFFPSTLSNSSFSLSSSMKIATSFTNSPALVSDNSGIEVYLN